MDPFDPNGNHVLSLHAAGCVMCNVCVFLHASSAACHAMPSCLFWAGTGLRLHLQALLSLSLSLLMPLYTYVPQFEAVCGGYGEAILWKVHT